MTRGGECTALANCDNESVIADKQDDNYVFDARVVYESGICNLCTCPRSYCSLCHVNLYVLLLLLLLLSTDR